MTTYSIYRITNLVNQKVYIGKTKNAATKRFNEHRRDAKNGSDLVLHRAIRKHGADNFSFDVIFNTFSESDLDDFERHFILIHDCCTIDGNDKGYNMTRGGEGTTGWNHTNDAKLKISQAHRGRVRQQDHSDAISKSKTGIQQTPEHAAKSAASGRKANAIAAEVTSKRVMIDGVIYRSQREAARQIGVNQSTVRRMIARGTATAV